MIEFSLKTALRMPRVQSVKQLKTSNEYSCLKLMDKDHVFIGYTRPYKVSKLNKAVSRWLFKGFPRF